MRVPSQAAEVVNVSERGTPSTFSREFRAIAHGLIKGSITALADGSLISQRSGKSDSGAGTSVRVNSVSNSRSGLRGVPDALRLPEGRMV